MRVKIMRTPPKYPSTPHWPWSQKIHRDDSVHDDPSYFVGKPVVITEKIDGGNTCLYQGNVFARSVSVPTNDKWFSMVKKHHAWKLMHKLEHGYAIYGEDIYGVHSIEYDPIREEETFMVFAVRDLSMRDYFCAWENVMDIASNLQMPIVPVLFRGTFCSTNEITSYFEEELKNPSELGGEREGFVMRLEFGFNADDFRKTVCKYVRPNHVQTGKHWTRNWKPCRLKQR